MMAKIFPFLILATIITISVPAFAFYPSGRINSDISYSNIELVQQPYSIRATGTLINHTSHPIRFNGTIMFVTIHRDALNSGKIYETIPANGTVQFNCRLEKDNFRQIQHCYNLEWAVKDYSRDRDRFKSSRTKPEKKSIGYSNTRASDAYISVSGKANHNSDQFKLVTGLYIAKVSHTGSGLCTIWLLHGDGTQDELITNEIGYIVESKAVRIDEDGYYLLNVSADGDWTVNMEYQEPKTAMQDVVEDSVQPTEIADTRGSADPVVIKLKNGRTMNADSYWEEGDKLKVSIYGGIMTVKKSDVQEIFVPEISNPPAEDTKTDNSAQPKSATPPIPDQEIQQKLKERERLSKDLEKAKQKEAELDRAIEEENERRRKFNQEIDEYLEELDRKAKGLK